MNYENALALQAELPESARVVDVDGGASPLPRADYVIDALSFDQRCSLGELRSMGAPRYSAITWCQVDLCNHQSWPFADKFFDFATCSHLLEDVRDPIWVCRELCRIAKAGYIETPSRILEQSLGVEHPCYTGYYHHRWLISKNGSCLEFRHKPHLLPHVRDAIVAKLGVRHVLNPKYAYLAFKWSDHIDYPEVLEFDEENVVEELRTFAQQARQLPGLIVSSPLSAKDRLRRRLYYLRLRWGFR
jgi:hypothetical protein